MGITPDLGGMSLGAAMAAAEAAGFTDFTVVAMKQTPMLDPVFGVMDWSPAIGYVALTCGTGAPIYTHLTDPHIPDQTPNPGAADSTNTIAFIYQIDDSRTLPGDVDGYGQYADDGIWPSGTITHWYYNFSTGSIVGSLAADIALYNGSPLPLDNPPCGPPVNGGGNGPPVNGGGSLPDIYPNTIGDEACDIDFAPLRDMYGDPQNTLCIYLHGLGGMYKQVDDISKDGPNDEPGWSQIFDLTRAKTEWLPWTGQLVGYPVPARPSNQSLEEYDASQRERIITRSAYRRGEIEMLYDIIDEQLNPPKRLQIFERDGEDPYLITVYIITDDIATSQAEIRRAALSQKIAGLIMDIRFVSTTDKTYDALRYSTGNYQHVFDDFPTYQEVFDNPGQF